MRPKTEEADARLADAVAALQRTIQEEYPVGSRVTVRRGYDKKLELEIVSHPSVGWYDTQYSYDLYCRNPKTGKNRTIKVRDVLEGA